MKYSCCGAAGIEKCIRWASLRLSKITVWLLWTGPSSNICRIPRQSIVDFKPADAQGKQHYRFWLHYAEGSLMFLLLMRLLTSLGKPPVPLGLRTLGGVIGKGAQKRTLIRNRKPICALCRRASKITPGFRVGEQLSMADIQMSFPPFALLARRRDRHLDHNAWKAWAEMRPAPAASDLPAGRVRFTIPGG